MVGVGIKIPLNELICATDEPLQSPLLITVPHNYSADAIKSFDDLLLYGDLRKDQSILETKGDVTIALNNDSMYKNLAASFINRGIDNPPLRNEIYSQLIKQLTNNNNKTARDRFWGLLYLTIHYFLPSKQLEPFLIKFLHDNFTTFMLDPKEGGEEKSAVGSLRRGGVKSFSHSPPLVPSSSTSTAKEEKEEAASCYDLDSALISQMCLDILHTNVLFMGDGTSYKLKRNVERDGKDKELVLLNTGSAMADEKTTLLLTNMKDTTRQYNVHLSHLMFHQVNRLRHLLLTSGSINAWEVAMNMSFQLASYNYVREDKLYVPLYAYYLPKILVYLAMKVNSLDGLNTVVWP
jgi:hypothetical protein